MSKILLVLGSPRGAASYSAKIANALVHRLEADHPDASVTVRDLGRDPLPHIGEDFVVGQTISPEARTESQKAAIELSDALVAELLEADIVVIASAMINFGLSSQLKTWFDNVIRARLTFAYGDKGPVGLVTGKKVYLVEARGGVYSQAPQRAMDFQEPYLGALLAFLGMTDVEPILVEGVGLGPEAADKAVNAALDRIPALVEKLAA